MSEVELKNVADYGKEKIDAATLNKYNYISTENLLPNRGGISTSDYLPGKGKVSKFDIGDTLVSNIRPYFKKIWHANEIGGCSNDVIVFKPNKNKIDPKFLYYQLSKDEFFDFMMSGANGTKMPRGNKNAIPTFRLNLPSLPIQKRIASILSAYDELIENNLKRIKLLEEIAQRTYEEWFVKFRVNGEQLPIDEATGLPKGWKYKPFHDLIDFKEGPGLRNTQYRDSGIPFLNNENDHVISTSGTLGRVVTIRKRHLPICLNTSLIRMRPLDNNFGKWLIKHTITNPKFKETMDSYANGSAQLNFGPIHLKQIKLIAPSQTIALEYEKIAEPIEELIKKLKDQNIFLKESRDILLPRLMSGTINVES
jgi:type I restriction enzyme S subunit